MTAFIANALPYAAVASHVLLAFLLAATLARKGWGRKTYEFLSRRALLLGLLVGLAAVTGSLFYSEVIGYAPCVLCWWQRVFLYPAPILFAIALWKKDRGVFAYAAALALLAALVALYQSYVSWGGVSILPCTAVGGECAKVYVNRFGYVTIPSMSLTVAVYILFLAWVNRLYRHS